MRTIACLGDSQTQTLPYYAIPPEKMWVERLAIYLRSVGGPNVQARSYGIGGQTTGEMLNRVDILSLWEVPDLAILYGGVNDNLATTIPTVSAGTSGTITVAGGATFYGVGFVVAYADGSIMAPPLTSVQLAVGSTGSIALTGGAALSTATNIGVYVTPTGYASAALATANNRALRLQTTLAIAASGSVTTLSAVTAQMPTAGTRAMSQGFCKALKYGVTGLAPGANQQNWFLGQANLPANTSPGQRAVVLDDTSATGGLPAVAAGQHATIAGDFSTVPQQTVWECRTPQASEAGWGRVAVTGTAVFPGSCSNIVLISTNYLNWTSGGDNAGTSTFYAPNVGIRLLTQAAATAENAFYADLFDFQAGVIATNETTQGSNSWHAIANNQHHNAYGHDIVARCVSSAIMSWPGLLAAVTR